ncbi:MAG: hypothetical protein V4655_12450 [Bdellovibrionota bacterium]
MITKDHPGDSLVKALRFSKQKLIGFCLLLAACGSGGSGDEASPGSPQTTVVKKVETTFTGSIKSVSGSQSEMKDWVVALINYDNFISSIGVVNAAGNFSLPFVIQEDRYTLALLDPDYKLQAVLTASGLAPNTIRQVFKLAGTQLPILVHNGPVINFTNTVGVSFDAASVPDVNGDLIPVGQETALLDAATEDRDADGLPNIIDPDIDGDGLINVLDIDDDGDAILDVFDDDANGDTVLDVTQSVGDQYFTSLLSYMSVQVLQDTKIDGSFDTSLLFTAKIGSDGIPNAIRVRGSSKLFEGATSVRVNPETGDSIVAPWDFSLSDDGLNEDGAASDGTYSRRVKLGTGLLPLGKQMIFLSFIDSVDAVDRVRELPFIFPKVVSGAVTGTYASLTKTVSLGGTPFGGETKFKWWVDIFDSTGKKVFSSAPVLGTTASYVIPDSVMQTGVTYTAKIVATTPERIPSYPGWIVRSASFNL